MRSRGTFYHLFDRVDGISLDTDKDDIGFPLIFFCRTSVYFQVMFPFQVGFQVKSVFADTFEMLSPCDTCHFFSCQCKKSGDTSSHTAGTYNQIVHGLWFLGLKK